MSRFFIDRPVFAWVIAIVIMLAGAIAISTLPIAQYPSIAPPTITVIATYPGASAKTLEDTVTQVIEQRLNGIDNLRYIESASTSDGTATITVTFEGGTNPDTAQVQVQNKVALATALLPQEVQQQGVQVNKSVRNFLIVVGLISEDGTMSGTDLADYNSSVMRDPISRLPGVGEIQSFGTQYAMRIWLDPDKLTKYHLATSDIVSAVRAQNAQVSAGALGALPAVPGQLLNATIMAQSRLQTPEQFEAILLRVSPDGSRVFLRDVARVELGSENYNVLARFNGKPASGMAIRPAMGANALETVDAVKQKVAEMSQFFPPGVRAIYPYDTTQFVRISVEEVVKTLIEAVVLVFLVMFLFLQSWRATLIPTIAVPVVLLGTFGVMAAAGYSINTLTLFGLVLAIGLLVDDAIVVVENVERVMQEEGLPPKEATRKSMHQISGALVGIGLVLCAAFVPMAFFTGSSGVIYRQFSLIIVSSVTLSVFVALILTPALCATLLKPMAQGHHLAKRGPFGWFNRAFESTADRYARAVGHFLRHYVLALIPYAAIAGAVVFFFLRAPTGFLPDEDTGVLFAMAQLPPGSTREQSDLVLQKMEKHFFEEEKDLVEGGFGVLGFSFSGNAQNQVLMFVKLKPWEERKLPSQKVKAIQGRAMAKFAQFKDALAFSFAPPAVLELGTATGFDLRLVDLGGLGHDALMGAQGQLLGMAMKNPVLAGVRPNGLADTAVYQIDIDQVKASALGLSLAEVNASLSTIWGSTYINDFIDKNRVKRVMMQGDAPFRMLPQDINRWHVRNSQGDMVPFSAFSSASWRLGSPKLERFNGAPSLSILGEPAPGHSSGEAMGEIEAMAKQLPPGIGIEWAGLSFEEQLSGSKSAALYAIALLMVFLCLAALYESWAIPFSVMMDMPLGALGVVAATQWRGMPNDIYFQIGLITIIGLSAKNAILVVEFAKEHFDRGATLIEAALHATRQRLRPILMTSIAFGLGVLPLALNTGAGSGSQNAIGTGIVGGAITTTLLGLFFVPLYFVVILRLFRVKPLQPPQNNAQIA
ncbi:MAG: efflux RND transporter permease subunit [Prosthecobacter sp.]|jgi:hydrophobe/amphiphile efflux-1 (HAE1) family protein|uniref:efflux RND transporter permease subunit n=1 Tax=Prosthecobacter sp. TaxID=1965333 RepID=UPI0019EB7455|nr:efflux RND transporter permease subunit [Prosthecobacter sp.]MBE2283428.1 efflux RND transporter permease subunit [Prosthecobacter sp.]